MDSVSSPSSVAPPLPARAAPASPRGQPPPLPSPRLAHSRGESPPALPLSSPPRTRRSQASPRGPVAAPPPLPQSEPPSRVSGVSRHSNVGHYNRSTYTHISPRAALPLSEPPTSLSSSSPSIVARRRPSSPRAQAVPSAMRSSSPAVGFERPAATTTTTSPRGSVSPRGRPGRSATAGATTSALHPRSPRQRAGSLQQQQQQQQQLHQQQQNPRHSQNTGYYTMARGSDAHSALAAPVVLLGSAEAPQFRVVEVVARQGCHGWPAGTLLRVGGPVDANWWRSECGALFPVSRVTPVMLLLDDESVVQATDDTMPPPPSPSYLTNESFLPSMVRTNAWLLCFHSDSMSWGAKSPCRDVIELVSKLNTELPVGFVNVTTQLRVRAAFNIDQVPLVSLYKDGRIYPFPDDNKRYKRTIKGIKKWLKVATTLKNSFPLPWADLVSEIQ